MSVVSLNRHNRILRSGPKYVGSTTMEVEFTRPLTDAEVINFWVAVKDLELSPVRPDGWEPSPKGDFGDWEEVGGDIP